MNVQPEVRNVRDAQAKTLIREGKTGERFQNMTAERHPTLGTGWFGFLKSDPQMGAKAQLAYNNAYTKYYTLTGDPDTSEEAAYNEVWATYKPTEVNGKTEIWRDAPEIRYNMKTDEVRSDLSHWMGTNTDYEGDMENIRLMENVDTPYHTGDPQYSLLVVDPETGITEPLMDQTGVHITWKPDYEGFNERKRNKAVEMAKKERAYQEQLEEERKSKKLIPAEVLEQAKKPQIRIQPGLPEYTRRKPEHPDTGKNIRDLVGHDAN
jgi:hypothetical protein